MNFVADIKKFAEQLTGGSRPTANDLPGLIRIRRTNDYRFRDDGLIPNNRLPLIYYRGAVDLPAEYDPPAVFEALFEANGWGSAWRGEIYDYLHYHSRIHEVLGIARGSASVRVGGKRGRKLHLKAGDVLIIPAGVGHQSFSSSSDFLVVGAYPPAGTYDECLPRPHDHDEALKTIAKVRPPRTDPVYGKRGPLSNIGVDSFRSRRTTQSVTSTVLFCLTDGAREIRKGSRQGFRLMEVGHLKQADRKKFCIPVRRRHIVIEMFILSDACFTLPKRLIQFARRRNAFAHECTMNRSRRDQEALELQIGDMHMASPL